MGKEAMTDFVLDTKGHCFLCMDLVSSPLIKLGSGDQPGPTSDYNVHYLTRFLKIDMRKAFKDTASIPPKLLTKVHNSKLKTDICEECIKLSEQFSKLHRKLEKVRLEVDFCLGEIRKKLVEADDKIGTTKFQDGSGREPNFSDDLLKLEVVEVLRREAVNQCTAMLSCPFQRIRLENMTEEQVGSEILNITSKSRKDVPAWNETASSSSFQSTIGGSHDTRVEISEVKLERNSPNLSPDSEETGDCNEFDNYASVAGDDSTDDSVPEQKYTKSMRLGKLRNKSKIQMKDGLRKNNGSGFSGVIPPPIKVAGKMGTGQGQYIKSKDTGKCKCRLCPKIYTTPTNFFHHYKGVHAKEKFKCGLCKIEYPYKQLYDFHYLNVHAGIRYQCGKCSRSFTQKRSLYRHNINAH